MVSVNSIREFCISELARMLEIEATMIDASDTFTGLGLDSAMSVHFVIAVEEKFDLELYPSVTEDYPTLGDFCGYITTLTDA
ncbi:acyl carrier protein [Rhizobium sp. SL86]|uniref:acyl carrier protein n=1 Tax=Rhizobium sp. SL86 TaxID=2995148 RepID=UPI002276F632|nr:acyl carrier protein [Rhizobium sp. SL86]MCY1669382.1 acyl carrier protein [Rhizobium sp. SL86]